jgi:ABC-type branched-subunit amino acid transport system ATPase component/branched-subunit amino acid ABC-type transport system permease component
MTSFLQFALIGLGLGSAYALFAQGAVLIYRGSGIVNFGHGALGMLTSYITFLTCQINAGLSIGVSIVLGILAAVVTSLAFQFFILRRLTNAAPITRLISTLGLLAVVQAGVELKYGSANQPIEPFLPHDTFNWGGVRVQEQVLYVVGVTFVVTFLLWALTRYTRIGLAITASAQNERAVQTLGWSPNRLAVFTWGVGAAVAGIAGVLVAPLTGLSTVGFTLVVTIAALAAALLGGFRSFPLTLAGGLVVGMGESLVTLYKSDIERITHQQSLSGLNRAVPFLIILIVLVVRGRGLPLRSHLSDRLPSLGTGRINPQGIVVAAGILLVLLFTVFNGRWAAATYISMSSAIVILSVVVLTGYAGQVSLAQWTLSGVGALAAGSFILRAGWPMELAIPAGILVTIPVGLIFALPALRTRGVNLAVVTLGLGFAVQQVVFVNGNWIGHPLDAGTKIGSASLFGIKVDAATHPHRWAVVSLIAFVLASLLVANLRRSRTGLRLIAVRTNERAAASLGISVFSVKLYAFGVAAALAGLGGILVGFSASVITYESFGVFDSINAVGGAVIGGLGFVIGAAFAAPNAIGGLGTRIQDLIHLGAWDKMFGGAILFLIILTNQDGTAAVASAHMRPLLKKLRLAGKDAPKTVLPEAIVERVAASAFSVNNLTVRFGAVTAVNDVSFTVNPGEVVGLIGPNGAGKTTVIDAVTGFVKPTTGTMSLDGQSLDGWSATKRAKHGLRRSFQSLELFEDVSVEDNIRSGADTSSKRSWLTDLLWPGNHPLTSTAVTAIREFDLEPMLHQLPGELPYGRRRLVGIARAVACGPSILMLDEPAAGLDDAESRELGALITRLAKERGMGVLLVEHDVGLVMSTCDRIVVIEFGKVIATGTPEEIRNDPAVLAAYLGGAPDGDPADGVAASIEASTQISELVSGS